MFRGQIRNVVMTINGIDVDVARRICHVRKLNDWTQKDLANRIGVDQSLVCAWEKGRAVPSSERLDRICQAFGCSRSDFASGKVTRW